MARRRLSPEEQALWRQLTEGVRPLRPMRPAAAAVAAADTPPAEPPAAKPPKRVKGRVPPPRPAPVAQPGASAKPAAVLDSSWEKRIRSGLLQPERSIDLHGHSVGAAHQRLDGALAQALAEGVRVLLVVTGKPRPHVRPSEPGTRGAIRAEIGDWLARSPHAANIASVRIAHPRHGGEGALYLILRRGR